MTRKDVCTATGISVKTLRLYEEKGLIAPKKEYRNGREYRIYSQELVEQLEEIVTLRKALFTMEEIRVMQETPEKIPEILEDYQLWLQQQTQQFQRLSQAAERLDPETITDIPSLLTGISQAAKPLPLPQGDQKPNFKRLDEMEEVRHVTPQVFLDETIPNDKVFRQVNLMMDRDRGNNYNIALGQLRELEEPKAEGPVPVRRETREPLWYKIPCGILSAVFAVSLAAGIINICTETLEVWPIFLVCGVSLALRLLLSLIPHLAAHRSWLKTAQTSDAERTDSTERYQADRKKRRTRIIGISIGGILGVLAISLGIWALCQALYAEEHPDTDMQVLLVVPGTVNEAEQAALEAVLSPIVGDTDGNGEMVTQAKVMVVTQTNWYIEGEAALHPVEFDSDTIADYGLPLVFISDLDGSYGFNPCDEFAFDRCCQALPEDLRDGDEVYRVRLSGSQLFPGTDLESLTLYGCIPESASAEQYKQAVTVLRALVDG